MNVKENKPWYKKWWVWLIIIVVLVGIGGASGNSTQNNSTEQKPATTEAPKQEEKPQEVKWDIEANYAKISNDMTKAEVEAAIGKKSESCTENTSEYLGKTEYCNYGGFGDTGMITVTYSNDKVSSKTKSKF